MSSWKERLHIDFEDVSQIIIGAAVLSVPIAFTEEAWRISVTLPAVNMIFLMTLSLAFITIYVYQSIYQRNIRDRVASFCWRILIEYVLSCIVAASVLFALNKLPVGEESFIALKRVIILALPASMGAVVVDGLDKE